MFLFKADNIYDVIKPLHFFSQTTGLTSFTIRRRNGVFVGSIRWFNVLFIALSTVWTIFVMFVFITDRQKMWKINGVQVSEVFQNSMFCVLLAFLTTSIMFNWWTFGSKRHFARALNLLCEVDEELLELKVPVGLRKHKVVIVFFAVFVKSFTTASLCVTRVIGSHSKMFRVNIILLISMYLCIEMAIFAIHHYTFWMWAVKIRYPKINLFLKENFLKSVNHNMKEGNEKLCRAALLHDKLVDVSECINRCYGVPVRQRIKISLISSLMKYF